MGILKAIWIKRAKLGPMDPADSATLIANKGIEGNANRSTRRQVTIIEEEVWNWLMAELNSELPPETRRANLMVSGISLKDSRKKVLHVGACRIQIFGETKPCERMEEAQPGLQELMYPEWRGGAYGVVLNDGEIRVGDEVAFES